MALKKQSQGYNSTPYIPLNFHELNQAHKIFIKPFKSATFISNENLNV